MQTECEHGECFGGKCIYKERQMGDKSRGLYRKFAVVRTDGTSEIGEKHYGCEYFVLDLTHDKHAKAALLAYAASCETEYPLLAADLRAKYPAPAAPVDSTAWTNDHADEQYSMSMFASKQDLLRKTAAPVDGGAAPLPQVMVTLDTRVWEGAAPVAESTQATPEASALADRYFGFVEMVAKGRSPTMKDVADAMELERDHKRALLDAQKEGV